MCSRYFLGRESHLGAAVKISYDEKRSSIAKDRFGMIRRTLDKTFRNGVTIGVTHLGNQEERPDFASRGLFFPVR